MTAIDRHFRLRLGRVWEEIRIARCPMEPVPGDAVASSERKRQVSASSSAIVEPWVSTARTDVAARLLRLVRRLVRGTEAGELGHDGTA